jgi:hypothetical protein
MYPLSGRGLSGAPEAIKRLVSVETLLAEKEFRLLQPAGYPGAVFSFGRLGHQGPTC